MKILKAVRENQHLLVGENNSNNSKFLIETMEARRKSVQLISELSNAAGQKSNIHKSSVFLYTSNEHVQKHNLKDNLKLIQNEMLGII